jgi:hypothetical protein
MTRKQLHMGERKQLQMGDARRAGAYMRRAMKMGEASEEGAHADSTLSVRIHASSYCAADHACEMRTAIVLRLSADDLPCVLMTSSLLADRVALHLSRNDYAVAHAAVTFLYVSHQMHIELIHDYAVRCLDVNRMSAGAMTLEALIRYAPGSGAHVSSSPVSCASTADHLLAAKRQMQDLSSSVFPSAARAGDALTDDLRGEHRGDLPLLQSGAHVARLTPLQAHGAFFDTNGDGLITLGETYSGLRRIGLGVILGVWGALLIHLSLSWVTGDWWMPDPTFRIEIKNMHKGERREERRERGQGARLAALRLVEIETGAYDLTAQVALLEDLITLPSHITLLHVLLCVHCSDLVGKHGSDSEVYTHDGQQRGVIASSHAHLRPRMRAPMRATDI